MADDKLTTIQIDTETRDRLKEIAIANERTSAGQLRWLVNQEYERLQNTKAEVKAEAKGKRKKAVPVNELPKAE